MISIKLINVIAWYIVIALALLALSACVEPPKKTDWLGTCEQVAYNYSIWRCEIEDEAVCFATGSGSMVCHWYGENNGSGQK